jgi:hypothetical protein
MNPVHFVTTLDPVLSQLNSVHIVTYNLFRYCVS